MLNPGGAHKFERFIILFLIISVAVLLRRALMPLWIALAIAYVLDPLVGFWQEKLGGRRILGVILGYITVLSALTVLIWSFADIVSDELARGTLQKSLSVLQEYYEKYQDLVEELSGFSLSGAGIRQLLKKLGTSSVNILISLVASIYILRDKKFFLSLLNKSGHLLFPQKTHGIIREIAYDINDVVSAFIKGVFIDSSLIAIMDTLVLTILGVEYALFIGCFAGIMNIIPYFGPVLGLIPAFISAFSDGGFAQGFIACAGLLLVQQLESNYLYPKIVGKSVGLHPLFVLLSVSAAGYFGGILWMILAVPIAGIIKVLVVTWAYRQ